MARMLARKVRRSRRTDCAHREMDRARPQSCGKALDAEVSASKNDLADRVIIREHADDDLAVEQMGNVGCRLETERPKLVQAIRTTDIGDHGKTSCGQVFRHGSSH